MSSEAVNKVCALLTGFSEKSLREGKEPLACAVGIDEQGKMDLISLVFAVPNATNRQMIGIAVKALREADKEHRFVAVGMCFPVTLTNKDGSKSDALYVCLEERNGEAEDVLFAYRKKFFGGVKFDPPQSKLAEARVYGPKGDELIAESGAVSFVPPDGS
jgi:hypothetical protein